MAITSNDDIADFRGPGLARDDRDSVGHDIGATAPRDAVPELRSADPSDISDISDTADAGVAETSGPATQPVAVAVTTPAVWVLCRKRASGDVETVRAFDDETRARADLDLVASVSDDEFWVASVPMIETGPGGANGARGISRVQALALTWLAQGAEAEASVPLDDPVVVSPRHVRGFVSVPSHEWQEMEDRGWVRDGLITPSGADQVGLVRKMSDHDIG